LNKIFYQGDLDGTCFLYCLVNSLSKLNKTYSREDIEKYWVMNISKIPHVRDYLNASRGTIYLDNKDSQLLKFCNQFFNQGVKNKKKYLISFVTIKSKTEILNYLGKNTVIILDMEKGNHWECIVGKSSNNRFIYGICSLQSSKPIRAKCEKLMNERIAYNKKIDLNKIRLTNISNQRIILITKI